MFIIISLVIISVVKELITVLSTSLNYPADENGRIEQEAEVESQIHG